MDKWYLNRGPLHKSLSLGTFVFGNPSRDLSRAIIAIMSRRRSNSARARNRIRKVCTGHWGNLRRNISLNRFGLNRFLLAGSHLASAPLQVVDDLAVRALVTEFWARDDFVFVRLSVTCGGGSFCSRFWQGGQNYFDLADGVQTWDLSKNLHD